ncbi:MAG TPA: dihydrolipoamide acetyltransferase family protein [Actinomycetes bacterium]
MPEREFKLPDLGEGLTDGEVVRWLVQEGDTITLNQPIVEVETAKAVVEIPAPYAGRVTKLHAAEGESLDVGAPLLSVDTGAGAAPPAAGEPGVEGFATPDAEEPASQATLVGPGERQQVRRRRAAAAPAAARARPAAPVGNGSQQGAAIPPAARPLATPPVRKYAKDHGVDLTLVGGTGKDGRITREDVDRALEPAAQPAAEPAAAPAAARERTEERVPVRGTRKATAAAMVGSAFTIPHVTEFLTVDATALMELRDRIKALPQAEGVRVTPLPLVAKALCVALRQFPMMNSAWDEQAGEIVVKHYVNLGIATDTPTGLLVPNVKDADTLGILDLAREIGRLTELARQRKVTPADLAGGTITITNVGGFGVETGTPIINQPECAILATGLIAPRPWVVDGELTVRQLMTTSVSFDHRIVDGAYAARFLAHLRDLLEDPALLAAY